MPSVARKFLPAPPLHLSPAEPVTPRCIQNSPMSTPTALSHAGKRLSALLALALLLPLPAQAVDLSGIYADGGTNVPSGPNAPVEEPSLRALLSLEFDSKLVSVRRDQTSHVVVKHSGDQLVLEVYDINETISWSARWFEGREYFIQGDRAVVRFPPTRVGGEELILVIERLPETGLLQVTAQRLSATMLGPAARKVGMALFYAMP